MCDKNICRVCHVIEAELDHDAEIEAELEAEAEESEREEESNAPCYREWDNEGWWCVNDHTGCIWNNGSNCCIANGNSKSPLGEEDQESEA